MKPWGRFVFVFLAYGMALLHTAVPHKHQSFGGAETTISLKGCVIDQSMADFLRKVFSTDLGYGHLETFQKNADSDIAWSLPGLSLIACLLALFLFTANRPTIACEVPSGYFEKLLKRLLLFSSVPLRAPPAVG